MENKSKSLNQLWREMGKPTTFKEFAENYNKEVVSFYSSASGLDTTSTTAVSTPSVNLPQVNYIALGVLVFSSIAIIYAINKNK